MASSDERAHGGSQSVLPVGEAEVKFGMSGESPAAGRPHRLESRRRKKIQLLRDSPKQMPS